MDIINNKIYRKEPNRPKDGDMYIDDDNAIYIYSGKKKFILTTMYQDDIKKLREERIKKLQKLNEKK